MSTLEKKAIAFEQLAAITNEADLDEILNHLAKLKQQEKSRVYNLSSHLDSIKERYSETLQKLAE
jgi:hypothetical protein